MIMFFFFYAFELFRAWFLWPIIYTILDFFINWIFIVITKGKVLNYTPFYSFKFFYSFGCPYTLYCSSALTFLAIFSVVILFPAIYTSSFFKPLFLLWSPLKRLLLLKSLIWLLLPRLLFVKTFSFRFL